jgi:hypothetical protein
MTHKSGYVVACQYYGSSSYDRHVATYVVYTSATNHTQIQSTQTGCHGEVVSVHAIKAYGKVKVQVHAFLTLAQDENVVSVMPWLIYPYSKHPQYRLNRRMGGPQSWSACFGEERNILLPPRIK